MDEEVGKGNFRDKKHTVLGTVGVLVKISG